MMKKIGNLVRWLIGLYIIFIGFSAFADSAATSILWVLTGLVILPSISKMIPSFKGRKPALIAGCIFLLFAGALAMPEMESASKPSQPSMTSTFSNEELKRWIQDSVTTRSVNVEKADIEKWRNFPEQKFFPVWKSVVLEQLEQLLSQEQLSGSADIASDITHFNSVAAYLKNVTALYESLYNNNEKIDNIKQYAEELSQIVKVNQELQKKYSEYSFDLATVYPTYETFYITQRLETRYSDNILGALQKEIDSYKEQSTSDWVAYDVEYILGRSMPGETFRVIHAGSLNPFTRTGAYEVCYVDTGTTTDLVDTNGFINTVPVLELIYDSESINIDRQEYIGNYDKCIVILNSLQGLLSAEESNDPFQVSSSSGFVGEWQDLTGAYLMEIAGADDAYTIDVSQKLSDNELRQWSLEGYNGEGNGIFYSGGYVDLYVRNDGTVGRDGIYNDASGSIFLTNDGVLHWDSNMGKPDYAVELTKS